MPSYPNAPHHLFIAGVPCTGKSLLGKWLGKNCGYVHIDAERKGGVDFDTVGVHPEWVRFLRSGTAEEFIRAVDRLGKPLVLNWGFPKEYFFIVLPLKHEGVDAWWFTGERGAARGAFGEREEKRPEAERIPVGLFDQQMDQIERQGPIIELLFRGRIIKGLDSHGRQRKPEELWEEMTSRSERLKKS